MFFTDYLVFYWPFEKKILVNSIIMSLHKYFVVWVSIEEALIRSANTNLVKTDCTKDSVKFYERMIEVKS